MTFSEITKRLFYFMAILGFTEYIFSAIGDL